MPDTAAGIYLGPWFVTQHRASAPLSLAPSRGAQPAAAIKPQLSVPFCLDISISVREVLGRSALPETKVLG